MQTTALIGLDAGNAKNTCTAEAAPEATAAISVQEVAAADVQDIRSRHALRTGGCAIMTSSGQLRGWN
jgi:hypothetical protein